MALDATRGFSKARWRGCVPRAALLRGARREERPRGGAAGPAMPEPALWAALARRRRPQKGLKAIRSSPRAAVRCHRGSSHTLPQEGCLCPNDTLPLDIVIHLPNSRGFFILPSSLVSL